MFDIRWKMIAIVETGNYFNNVEQNLKYNLIFHLMRCDKESVIPSRVVSNVVVQKPLQECQLVLVQTGKNNMQ
jgi:hypothetical protein